MQSKSPCSSASQVLGQWEAWYFPLEFNLNKQSTAATPYSCRLQKEKQKTGLENNDQIFMFFCLENKTSHVLPALTQTQFIIIQTITIVHDPHQLVSWHHSYQDFSCLNGLPTDYMLGTYIIIISVLQNLLHLYVNHMTEGKRT